MNLFFPQKRHTLGTLLSVAWELPLRDALQNHPGMPVLFNAPVHPYTIPDTLHIVHAML